MLLFSARTKCYIDDTAKFRIFVSAASFSGLVNADHWACVRGVGYVYFGGRQVMLANHRQS